jgi:hypothetical protein
MGILPAMKWFVALTGVGGESFQLLKTASQR